MNPFLQNFKDFSRPKNPFIPSKISKNSHISQTFQYVRKINNKISYFQCIWSWHRNQEIVQMKWILYLRNFSKTGTKFYKIQKKTLEYGHRRRQEGTQGTSPPPKLEKCCRKMRLFPKARFLATSFPKIDKNSNFLTNFYQKISKFSQNFPTICIFRPNARKINAVFLKFCWEYAKIMIFAIFSRNFWKFTQKFPKQLCFSSKRAKI